MKTCLIVDDSPIVRNILRNIVEELGFSCYEADNGQVAYDACCAQLPDAILLDWNMPVMNGLDFLKKLRKTAGGDKPKVIFCTSETDSKQIHKALNAGADEYVMKPFDGDIIRSKFRLTGLMEAK